MRSRRLTLSVLLVAALCAACGTETKDPSAGTTTTVPASPAASTSTTDAAPTTTASTTSEAPATTGAAQTSPTWDEFKNASIPALCTHPATTLVDGKDVSLEPQQGSFELLQTVDGGGNAIATDIESPDGPLTAVITSCDAGGVGWPHLVLFFAPGGSYYASTFFDGPTATGDGLDGAWRPEWQKAGAEVPARSGVRDIKAVGDTLVADVIAERADDASCCPSGRVTVTVRPSKNGVELVSVEPAQGE